MNKRLIAALFGLCVTPVAGAANDPDSIGRSVKYLDTLTPLVVSYYTSGSQCFQYVPTPFPQGQLPITCVPLTGAVGSFQPLPVTVLGDIVVGANESRSMLSLNLTPVADYRISNTSTVPSTGIVSTQIKVTIESSILNDPSLMNPRTGLPFDGKIELTMQWIFDQRLLDPNENFAVATKMPAEWTILSRKSLTSGYGLSATRAALVFARPITVKLSLTGNLAGAGRANFHVGGRLFGD